MTGCQYRAAAPEKLWRDHLTQADAACVERLALGETNAEIGAALFICPQTVKWHLLTAYARLGVHTRVQAARWWWETVELVERESYRREAA
jgi:DNA-binding CsgD family transcriptional regulator